MANSTLDLAGFLARMRSFLVDPDSLAYSDAGLTEGLRQAVGDLGRVYGAFVTIDDLDSATATTVNKLDEDLMVRGAAGYAARMRAVDRADSANLGQSMPSNLLEWSKNTIYGFDQALIQVKRRLLQQSGSNPTSLWNWDETNNNW